MTASAIQPSTSQHLPLAQQGGFSTEQIDLIKQTVAAGTSDLELALFLEVAKSSGLNPFQRQIYAVMRSSRVQVNGKWEQQQKMVIQTGIDGYRLIASRSGTHLGTTDPEFGPANQDGYPEWARVVVRRLVQGHVAEFPATARWSEYVQTKDEYANGGKTGKKVPTEMWARMPHTMLGKCAEALALRKAFPAELSGVYSDVEMAQADNGAPAPVQVQQEEKAAPAPQPDEEHIKKWGPKLAACREGLKKYGVSGPEVSEVLAGYDWRSGEGEAQKAYTYLVEWGKQLKAEREQEAQVKSDPVPVTEELATTAQIQQLQGAARSAGASTSADRALLWGSLLTLPAPIGTKALTEAQAAELLRKFEGMDGDARKQALSEAKKEAAGRLV